MATYTVWTLDVWGNPTDGYETNDRTKVGTVDIADPTDDASVRAALVAGDYLGVGADVDIDGDVAMLTVDAADDGCPLLMLVSDADDATDGPLTPDDIAHLRSVWSKRVDDNAREPTDEDYDEGGPETVSTSIGYVDVWLDGDVTSHGATITNVAE